MNTIPISARFTITVKIASTRIMPTFKHIVSALAMSFSTLQLLFRHQLVESSTKNKKLLKNFKTQEMKRFCKRKVGSFHSNGCSENDEVNAVVVPFIGGKKESSAKEKAEDKKEKSLRLTPPESVSSTRAHCANATTHSFPPKISRTFSEQKMRKKHLLPFGTSDDQETMTNAVSN